jgi:superoxide dismutase, Fe-Mn family
MTAKTERRDFIRGVGAAAASTAMLAGTQALAQSNQQYEHAYHMDYGSAAAKYIDIYMEAIKWDHATKLYDAYSKES